MQIMPRYIYDRIADVAVPAVDENGVWFEPPGVQYNERMQGLAEMAGRCATI